MANDFKNQSSILRKLRIEALNTMQEEAKLAIHSSSEVVLLSPTGTGKTLAFLLPIVAELDRSIPEVQALIIVPSRELAIQIEQVTREMGAGYKTNAFYGGRTFSKDRMVLKHRPAILIGTPGRIAHHLRKGTFSTDFVKVLVLDEFDKSLEIGFELEMKEICAAVQKVKKKILTSATPKVFIPSFVGLKDPLVVNYLDQEVSQLSVKTILSPQKDKLETLVHALHHIGNKPGIVFCNFKDSIRRVSNFLAQHGIDHGCFFGGMEQTERERVLIKFRNGTHRLIVATDLAARGLDIPEIKFILHYHLPLKEEEFTHRNGRTARMNRDGTAYVLQWEQERLPSFIDSPEIEELAEAPPLPSSSWKTIFISGGRRDKISKGDIAGFLLKQGQLKKEEVGAIELKQDCAFVAIDASKAAQLVTRMDKRTLKKRKVRLKII